MSIMVGLSEVALSAARNNGCVWLDLKEVRYGYMGIIECDRTGLVRR